MRALDGACFFSDMHPHTLKKKTPWKNEFYFTLKTPKESIATLSSQWESDQGKLSAKLKRFILKDWQYWQIPKDLEDLIPTTSNTKRVQPNKKVDKLLSENWKFDVIFTDKTNTKGADEFKMVEVICSPAP